MKNYRTSTALVIILMISLSAWGAAFVSDQGGTGREAPKPSKPTKTTPPAQRTPPPERNPSASRQSPCSAQSPTQATGRTHKVNLDDSVRLEMLEIPPGSFCMGSSSGGDEVPVHRATIHRALYIGKYEVTQAQWQAVMGGNPSYFKGSDRLPVEQVSWHDSQRFITKLNDLSDGFVYRLPTEAEWEYACRAGTTTVFAFGDSLSSAQANFDGNYPYDAAKGWDRESTTPVGSFLPNAFGLYDMHGNVDEWCQDFYDQHYYLKSPIIDPRGPSRGQYRVLRGGSWNNTAYGLTSASRSRITPDTRKVEYGVRLVAVRRTR